jgi:hypothetical protein
MDSIHYNGVIPSSLPEHSPADAAEIGSVIDCETGEILTEPSESRCD